MDRRRRQWRHAPRPEGLHHGALYVADVDTLRIFDLSTGAPLAPNPLFLNDVVVANDGMVYVTDNRNSGIFTVDPEGHASVLATGPQLGNPYGILLDQGNLSWVTFFGHEVRRRTRRSAYRPARFSWTATAVSTARCW